MEKKIGGGVGGSLFGWLVFVIIVLAVWFVVEYHMITMDIDLSNVSVGSGDGSAQSLSQKCNVEIAVEKMASSVKSVFGYFTEL